MSSGMTTDVIVSTIGFPLSPFPTPHHDDTYWCGGPSQWHVIIRFLPHLLG